MLLQTLVPPILYILLFYAVTVGLTLLIETPIIVRSGITDQKPYIRGVNIVTNVLMNMVLTLILFLRTLVLNEDIINIIGLVWFVLAELVLIPVSEALAYRKISGAGTKRIFLFTYLANLASCAAGILLDFVIRSLI